MAGLLLRLFCLRPGGRAVDDEAAAASTKATGASCAPAAQASPSLLQLPPDLVLQMISSRLCSRDRAALGQTCRQLRDLVDATVAGATPRNPALVTARDLQRLCARFSSAKGMRLVRLDLNRCHQLGDLAPLRSLEHLETLELGWCGPVRDLAPLASLTALLHLSIGPCISGHGLQECVRARDLSPLGSLAALQRLELRKLTCSDLAPLSSLGCLGDLVLKNCTQLEDLSAVASLSGLRHLALTECLAVSDIAPLARLSCLVHLSLEWCPAVSDLAPLTGLTGLSFLDIRGCGAGAVSHLGGVKQLAGLDLLRAQLAGPSPAGQQALQPA